MNTIQQKLNAVMTRIAKAETAYRREPGSVSLLAVSKTRPAGEIEAAWLEGQRCFAENYLQDALPKIEALAARDIVWHYIGPIQSNKTQAIAQHFSWVHSVAREKIARRLNAQRPAHLPPLNICLQVNISGEAGKSGVSPQEVPVLAEQIENLPRLRLRGLMAIPAKTDDPLKQRRSFKAVRELYENLREAGFKLDTLSMGMSNDLEAAIAEGSTLVRIGTAIFGRRQYPLK